MKTPKFAKTKTLPATLVAFATFLALGSSLHAADTPVNLVQWTFGSNLNPYSVSSGIVAPSFYARPKGNIVGAGTSNTCGLSVFERGATDSNLRTSTSAWGGGGSNPTFSLTTATARENYFEFVITPKADYQVTLDSIDFKSMAVIDPQGRDTVKHLGFWLVSSSDGFDTDSGTLLASGYYKDGDTDSTLQLGSANYVNYSITSFAGTVLTPGESVTFRFYVQASSTYSYVYFDNLVVTGSVAPWAAPAVPEPTTCAVLIGILALAIATLRRR
ncbi:hypothetical protein Ga0100231_019995 [Opitutaceae bacterium TAV4]|nr:hypothetical protein Ga0100231_019995 [Opitutaceae bacterium TAV4]RRK00343.1 hypothetical protein Ga0100230_020765 [Opitutaceae bacterium TAV3]